MPSLRRPRCRARASKLLRILGTANWNRRLWPRFDLRLFFFGVVGIGEFGEVVVGGVGVGVGEGGRSGEGGGGVEDFVPVGEFVLERELLFDVGDGGEHDLAHVGEGEGFADGDAVLGDGDEEFAEDVVDVGGGEEIAVEGDRDFVAEALGLDELKFLAGVESAERGMGRVAQHTAAAAVGELELAAESVGGAGNGDGHGRLLF